MNAKEKAIREKLADVVPCVNRNDAVSYEDCMFLLNLLTAERERSDGLRKSLEEIRDYFRYSEGTSQQADQIFLFNRIKKALSHPEEVREVSSEVTREEIADVMKRCFSLKIYLLDEIGAHLLTVFDVKRRGRGKTN